MSETVVLINCSSTGISRRQFSICLMRLVHMDSGLEISDEEHVNWEWLEQGNVLSSSDFHGNYC